MDENAERVEKLGVGRITGALLVALWAGVLVAVIVYRRHTDYVHHEALYWWEAFYRTGSIIFGGGQVSISPLALLSLPRCSFFQAWKGVKPPQKQSQCMRKAYGKVIKHTIRISRGASCGILVHLSQR